MTGLCRLLYVCWFIFCLATPLYATETPSDEGERIAQLEQQNKQLHQQLRAARRDLARERTEEQEAGWPQVLAGIGIIFGVCGVGMMVSARKRTAGEE